MDSQSQSRKILNCWWSTKKWSWCSGTKLVFVLKPAPDPSVSLFMKDIETYDSLQQLFNDNHFFSFCLLPINSIENMCFIALTSVFLMYSFYVTRESFNPSLTSMQIFRMMVVIIISFTCNVDAFLYTIHLGKVAFGLLSPHSLK